MGKAPSRRGNPQIFISWSNDRSKEVAKVLKASIKKFFPDIGILSSLDIRIGTPWFLSLHNDMMASSLGIICITPENTDSPWLHFEAGALSRLMKQSSSVIPYLFRVEPSKLLAPLNHYHGVAADELGTKDLINSNNKLLSVPQKDEWIDDIFEMSWPNIKAGLDCIPELDGDEAAEMTPLEKLKASVDKIESAIPKTDERLELLQTAAVHQDEQLKALQDCIDRISEIVCGPTLRGHFQDRFHRASAHDADWNAEADSWSVMVDKVSGVLFLNSRLAEDMLKELKQARIPTKRLKTDPGRLRLEIDQLLEGESQRQVNLALEACKDANQRIGVLETILNEYRSKKGPSNGDPSQPAVVESLIFSTYFKDVSNLPAYFEEELLPCLRSAISTLKSNDAPTKPTDEGRLGPGW